MDFDLLDLREASEKRYWIGLRLGNTLLFRDMKKQEGPCRVQVKSPAEAQVEEALKAITRAGNRESLLASQLASAPNRDERRAIESRLDDAERDAQKAIKRFLTTVICDWENIERGGKIVPFSDEALQDMAEPKGPLFRLAIAISQDMVKAIDPFTEADSA